MVTRNKGEADMYSITMLALGLAAWGLGFAAWNPRWRQRCSMGSLACCAASLCMVVFGLAHYADIEDVSAFLDTANAFRLCSGALLLGTLLLNAAAQGRSLCSGEN